MQAGTFEEEPLQIIGPASRIDYIEIGWTIPGCHSTMDSGCH